MDTQNPTVATATGMGSEPGTLSTITQQDFILTMAVMETDPCQARWEALASVLHTGEDWLHEMDEPSWQVQEELDVWRKMHYHDTELLLGFLMCDMSSCDKIKLSCSVFCPSSPEPPMHSPVSRNGFDMQSDVYKMLQDYVEPVSEPKQSGSFKYLQEILQAEDGGTVFVITVMASSQAWQICKTQNKSKFIPLISSHDWSIGNLPDSIIDNVNFPSLSK